MAIGKLTTPSTPQAETVKTMNIRLAIRDRSGRINCGISLRLPVRAWWIPGRVPKGVIALDLHRRSGDDLILDGDDQFPLAGAQPARVVQSQRPRAARSEEPRLNASHQLISYAVF